MQGEPSPHRLSLRLSVVEGMLHAVMLGASESYLGALAVQLGHRDRALALLATVPLLAGALAQLLAPPLTRLVGGRRRLVAFGALLQAGSALVFVELARGAETALAPLLWAKTAFWVFGSVIMPAWSAWMGDLIEGADRTRYFGMRSAWASIALVVAFVVGGAWLHGGRAETLSAYADLFLVAFVARAASALLLALQDDPSTGVPPRPPRKWRALLLRVRWRVPVYMALLMFGTNVATPFFTPYMLRTLELDYWQYTKLMSVAIVAKAVVFPLCHPLALRFGMRAVLWTAGVGVGLTPLLWYGVLSLHGLYAVEAFAGAVWAAWEYSTFQLLLSASGTRYRLSFLSIAGTLTAAAQLAGALAGTLLIERWALDYRQVFVASSILRLSSLVVLALQIDTPTILGGQLRRFAVRLVTVRPNAGGVVRPLEQDDPD